jgi:aspartate aminotransferase
VFETESTNFGKNILVSESLVGAMYIFAKINQEGFNGVEFANNALEKGLAVAPGEGFGNYTNFIRISACQDEKALMEGMHILGNIMRDN